MPAAEVSDEPGSIPVIYVRGNHYQVGFQVGRTFSHIIQSYVEKHKQLNSVFLPLYNTDEGKVVYDVTLAAMKRDYPQYVSEIEGTAEGAKVPFYKLFLLHMDDILPGALDKLPDNQPGGCSSVLVKAPGEEILGHNEDASVETLNHFYLISAHVISDEPQGKWKIGEERFTSLCYAGTLPGYTMSYNNHGLIFSVNVICVKKPQSGRTPRTFLTRSLLAAQNVTQAKQMMKDAGLGIGNGVSLNMIFLSEEPSVFFNAELAPSSEKDKKESIVNIVPVNSDQYYSHCNRFLRLETPEICGLALESSSCRHEAIDKLPKPKSLADVINILGDESNRSHPVYRRMSYNWFVTIATVSALGSLAPWCQHVCFMCAFGIKAENI